MVKQSSPLCSLIRKLVLTFLAGLGVILLFAFLGVRSCINRNLALFTTTTSPRNTYVVNLKGAKQRPFLAPYTVSADIDKMGEPYVSNIELHTAWDAFDLSFELGFPEIRWPANNVVEFYRPEDFEHGNDVLIVQNRSGKPLKCLFVEAGHKFLIVDMRPGASLSVRIPRPRGDSQWIAFKGVLDDGTKIPPYARDYRRYRRGDNCTYLLSVLESGSSLETRMTACQ